MNQSITIGMAALLVGGAGGFIIGHSGADKTSSESVDHTPSGAKVRRDVSSTREDAVPRRSRAGSLQAAMREPGQGARIQALIDLYSGLGPAELEEEAAKLDSLPMGDRILASMLLFSRWGEVDPIGALEHTKTMGMGGMFAKPTVLRSWASVDPVNAAKYYTDNPSEFAMMGGRRGPGSSSGSEVIAREWAKLDPDAALAWANTLDGRDKSSALVSVVSEMAVKDPAGAAELAAGFDDEEQGRAYREIAEQWARQDFSEAEAWISTLSGEAKDGALGSAIEVLASTDPQGAAAMLSQMDEGRSRDRAVEDIAQAWASEDPAQAAEWLVGQETDDMGGAMRRVMMSWVGQDSASALSFVESQPAGETRDSAATTYLWMNRSGDPQESLGLAETISDENSRNRAIGMTARRWMEEDEAGARAYVEGSEFLSDDVKERILSSDDRGGPRGRGR